MNNKLKYIIIACAFVFVGATAQENNRNIPFKPGEELTYDMYFKYGMVNAKAGASSLKVTEGTYGNTDGFKFTLYAKSSGAAKKFYNIADTLTSFTTKDLIPLAFTKDAHEGKDHTIERAVYAYSSGSTEVNNKRTKNGVFKFDTTLVSATPIYDMVSILYYARTLDLSSLEKGEKISVSYLSGKRMESMDIVYKGLKTIQANDGREYNCIELVMLLNENAFEDKNEAMRVYVSNDNNRVPIRIDSKLKIGSTRIILNNYKL